jgi:probable rRNA maturation factor
MKISLFGPWGLTPAKKRLLERAVKTALGRRSARQGELCLVLMEDREVRKMNRSFLRRDGNTDVIAFGYQEGTDVPKSAKDELPFGDIYISKGVARRQAAQVGHPVFDELVTLAVHGALHLAGHDDGKAGAKKRMFERQDKIIRQLLK